MSPQSKPKGDRAEREIAATFRRLGIEAITSRDVRGGAQGGVDIIAPDLPVSVEVKDSSRDQLPSWLDQARRQGDASAPGAVFHKRRGKARGEEWFVTMRVDEFVKLVRPDLEF